MKGTFSVSKSHGGRAFVPFLVPKTTSFIVKPPHWRIYKGLVSFGGNVDIISSFGRGSTYLKDLLVRVHAVISVLLLE